MWKSIEPLLNTLLQWHAQDDDLFAVEGDTEAVQKRLPVCIEAARVRTAKERKNLFFAPLLENKLPLTNTTFILHLTHASCLRPSSFGSVWSGCPVASLRTCGTLFSATRSPGSRRHVQQPLAAFSSLRLVCCWTCSRASATDWRR